MVVFLSKVMPYVLKIKEKEDMEMLIEFEYQDLEG
jgi:hypothetical protein